MQGRSNGEEGSEGKNSIILTCVLLRPSQRLFGRGELAGDGQSTCPQTRRQSVGSGGTRPVQRLHREGEVELGGLDPDLVEVELVERLADAFFMKAKVSCGGQVAARFEFACTLAEPQA